MVRSCASLKSLKLCKHALCTYAYMKLASYFAFGSTYGFVLMYVCMHACI